MAAPRHPSEAWTLHRPGILSKDLQILDESGVIVFCAAFPSWSKAAIILRTGANKDAGAVLGYARFPALSSDIEIALGDPKQKNLGISLTRSGLFTNAYSWTLPAPSSSSVAMPVVWKKTNLSYPERTIPASSAAPAASSRSERMGSGKMKLVHATAQDVVLAVVTSKGWRDDAKVLLYNPSRPPASSFPPGPSSAPSAFTPEQRCLIMLSALAWSEKLRRQQRSAGSASMTATSASAAGS